MSAISVEGKSPQAKISLSSKIILFKVVYYIRSLDKIDSGKGSSDRTSWSTVLIQICFADVFYFQERLGIFPSFTVKPNYLGYILQRYWPQAAPTFIGLHPGNSEKQRLKYWIPDASLPHGNAVIGRNNTYLSTERYQHHHKLVTKIH